MVWISIWLLLKHYLLLFCIFLTTSGHKKNSILLIIILNDLVFISTMTNRIFISNTNERLPDMYYKSLLKFLIHAQVFLACNTLTFWTGKIFLISLGIGSIFFLTFKPSSKRHKISQRMKFNFFWAYSCIISSNYHVSIFTKKELSILT